MRHIVRALQNCCSCDAQQNRKELRELLTHLIEDHDGDQKATLLLAAVFAQYHDGLSYIPLRALHERSKSGCIVWLKFLKVVLSNEDIVPSRLWTQFLCHALLRLLSEAEAQIVPITIEVIVLLLSDRVKKDGSATSAYDAQLLKDTNGHVWTAISNTVKKERRPSANIYKAWVKWLRAYKSLQLTSGIFIDAQYAKLVADGLRARTQEIQKLCLYIMRQSHMILVDQSPIEPSMREELDRSVNRYCRAFETIIMGGYALQASECLAALTPDFLLEFRGSEMPFVGGSWWMLLVTTSLQASKSDSTRKNVGNWILKHTFADFSSQPAFEEFLESTFFPWAFQAQYFLSTVTREGDTSFCEHGGQLCLFVSHLLAECTDSQAYSRYLSVVLRSLHSKSTSAYAYVYVLHSIVHCLNHRLILNVLRGSPQLDDLKLQATKQAFTRSQRYIIDHLLAQLANRMQLQLKGKASDSVTSIIQFQPLIGVKHSHGSFVSMVEQQIVQHGFVIASERIQNFLVSSGDGIENLLKEDDGAGFAVIWAESTRQRHTRESLIHSPDIFLADVVITASKSSQNLRSTVFRVMDQLLDLAHTRIYIWAPLARRLHQTFIMHDHYQEFNGLLEKLLGKFVRLPPVPSTEYLLECALTSLVFSDEESRSHPVMVLDDSLGHAYMYDIINRFSQRHIDMAERLFDFCLQPWLTGKDKLKTMGALQASIILAQSCIACGLPSEPFIARLQRAVSNTKSPRYMFLLELAIVSCYWHSTEDIEDLALLNLNNFDDCLAVDGFTPKEIASRLKIYVSLASHHRVGETFIGQVMAFLPAFCASPKIAVRIEALYTVIKLMNIVEVKGIDGIRHASAYQRLRKHALSLLDSKGLPASRQKEEFDAMLDQNLATIFDGDYLQLEESAAIMIDAKHFRFIEQHNEELGLRLPAPVVSIGQRRSRRNRRPMMVAENESSKKTASPPAEATYQSKYIANQDLVIAPVPVQRSHEILLVASLIDSPFNLGGLCRAAEIYACAELHIPKLSILQDRSFTSVSVSSEAHISIFETPAETLIGFLKSKRQNGYSIVGVEQTDSSLVLGADGTSLPAKSVIVMGAERTGIPADILAECDICVEIKQWGITRSLNVQTAAATILYEWRKQHG